MKTYKCDRCGTYYDEVVDIDTQPYIVKKDISGKCGFFVLADLCVNCYKELNKFMMNEGENGNA